jgi:hypothetical protein
MPRRRYNPYHDRFCADGVISSGWRYVRKGGRVKIAGQWWQDHMLEEIVGEYVKVCIQDYWMSAVTVERGVMGCTGYYCTIRSKDEKQY